MAVKVGCGAASEVAVARGVAGSVLDLGAAVVAARVHPLRKIMRGMV